MSDGRQTAFPGIFIDSIGVEGKTYDTTGVGYDPPRKVIERGMEHDFNNLKTAAGITTEKVNEVINSAEEMIGPIQDEFTLIYNLKVKAFPNDSKLLNSLQKRGIEGRARVFARAKNPTELEIIDIGRIEKNKELSYDAADIYDVEVRVTK